MHELTLNQYSTITGGNTGADISTGFEYGREAGNWVGEKIAELIGICKWFGTFS